MEILTNNIKKFICKIFSHIYPDCPDRVADLPSSSSVLFGGLYVSEERDCRRCGNVLHTKGAWD